MAMLDTSEDVPALRSEVAYTGKVSNPIADAPTLIRGDYLRRHPEREHDQSGAISPPRIKTAPTAPISMIWDRETVLGPRCPIWQREGLTRAPRDH